MNTCYKQGTVKPQMLCYACKPRGQALLVHIYTGTHWCAQESPYMDTLPWLPCNTSLLCVCRSCALFMRTVLPCRQQWTISWRLGFSAAVMSCVLAESTCCGGCCCRCGKGQTGSNDPASDCAAAYSNPPDSTLQDVNAALVAANADTRLTLGELDADRVEAWVDAKKAQVASKLIALEMRGAKAVPVCCCALLSCATYPSPSSLVFCACCWLHLIGTLPTVLCVCQATTALWLLPLCPTQVAALALFQQLVVLLSWGCCTFHKSCMTSFPAALCLICPEL